MGFRPDKVRVREPYPIQAFEFLEADGEELLRLWPRSRPLGRGCKEALAISAIRHGCYAMNLQLENVTSRGRLDVHTLLRYALSDVDTSTLVSNGWQTRRRTYVFLRQLMHRFAELGTIGSPRSA